MSSRQPVSGSATLEDFFYWINERHRIYHLKESGEPRPWTHDPILDEWKFTNVFRELDHGTIILRKMIEKLGFAAYDSVIFNVVWYRLFNLADNAEGGPFENTDQVEEHITRRFNDGKQVFTNAHLTLGTAGEKKHVSMFKTLRRFEEELPQRGDFTSLQEWFNWLLQFNGIGPFLAYEITCDLRFELRGDIFSDRFDWANIGPGAERGLTRLGLPIHISSLRFLFNCAWNGDSDSTRKGFYLPRVKKCEQSKTMLDKDVFGCYVTDPPFELREIEHSLCEFDKYQRVKLGEGTPRMRYKQR